MRFGGLGAIANLCFIYFFKGFFMHNTLSFSSGSGLPLRGLYETRQVGSLIGAFGSKEVEPLVGSRELHAVVLLPSGRDHGNFLGFNIIPTSLGYPIAVLSSMNLPDLGLRKIKGYGGRVELRYLLKEGEKIRLVSNNSFPVYCVLSFV